MKTIDVLSNELEPLEEAGHLSNGLVPRIWLDLPDDIPAVLIPFPDQLRIPLKRLERRQLLRTELLPEAIFASERRHAGFSRHPCASGDHDAFGSLQDSQKPVGKADRHLRVENKGLENCGQPDSLMCKRSHSRMNRPSWRAICRPILRKRQAAILLNLFKDSFECTQVVRIERSIEPSEPNLNQFHIGPGIL